MLTDKRHIKWNDTSQGAFWLICFLYIAILPIVHTTTTTTKGTTHFQMLMACSLQAFAIFISKYASLRFHRPINKSNTRAPSLVSILGNFQNKFYTLVSEGMENLPIKLLNEHIFCFSKVWEIVDHILARANCLNIIILALRKNIALQIIWNIMEPTGGTGGVWPSKGEGVR